MKKYILSLLALMVFLSFSNCTEINKKILDQQIKDYWNDVTHRELPCQIADGIIWKDASYENQMLTFLITIEENNSDIDSKKLIKELKKMFLEDKKLLKDFYEGGDNRAKLRIILKDERSNDFEEAFITPNEIEIAYKYLQ